MEIAIIKRETTGMGELTGTCSDITAHFMESPGFFDIIYGKNPTN